ncbi:MAG TPA: hypothetical protein VMW69_16080 [Spirochaetia bacterium]|nr:hypothetical protein [Spirochaetia bacterium]
MKTKSVFMIALASLCVLAALVLTVKGFLVGRPISQVWKGYYTVLVSDAVPVGEVQRRLDLARISDISAANSIVEFDDFSHESSVSVAGLPGRLDPLDPRYDPYLREIPSYFHQGRWNIIYLQLATPVPFAYLTIGHVLRGLPWRAADFNWRASLLCTLFLGVVMAYVLRRSRRPRIETLTLLCGGAPWLAAVISGNYTAALGAGLVYLGWASIIELGFPAFRYYLECRTVERERLVPMAGNALATFFAACLLAGIEPEILPFLKDGSGGLLLLSAGLIAIEMWKWERRQHKLYFPVTIGYGDRRTAHFLVRSAAVSWVAVLLLASPLIALRDWHGDVEIPTPVLYPGEAQSWGGLRMLWDASEGRGLPNLSDYVAHRAYQAGLPYGASFEMPRPNEQVMEATYSRTGDRIHSGRAIVESYSDEWFRRVLAEGGGVVRLLEAQPGLVAPTLKRIFEPAFPVSYLPLFWLAALVVCIPAVFVRRRDGLETIGRLGISVSAPPEAILPQNVRFPADAPRRKRTATRVREEERELVSNTISEGDR